MADGLAAFKMTRHTSPLRQLDLALSRLCCRTALRQPTRRALRNRVVMAGHTAHSCAAHASRGDLAERYGRRSGGGQRRSRCGRHVPERFRDKVQGPVAGWSAGPLSPLGVYG